MIFWLLLLAAAPTPGSIETFKDWTVGCDNGRACHATSLMPEDGAWDESLTISVKREPGAASVPQIAILGPEGKAPRLSAEGRRLAVRLTWRDDAYQVDPRDVSAMVAVLRTAPSIAVDNDDGAKLGMISLAGASAALLYVDDAQGRVGTVTALARPGAKGASSVPPAPPLPVIRSAAVPGSRPVTLSPARVAALRKQSGCEIDTVGGPDGIEVEALDASRSLILLSCGSGAYNLSSVPYVAARKGKGLQIELARFDLKPDWGEGGLPMLVNAGWDPKGQLLTGFSKGRGIGDCGVGSDYAWDGQGFRLAQQIEMHECRGSIDYITTWRATLIKR